VSKEKTDKTPADKETLFTKLFLIVNMALALNLRTDRFDQTVNRSDAVSLRIVSRLNLFFLWKLRILFVVVEFVIYRSSEDIMYIRVSCA